MAPVVVPEVSSEEEIVTVVPGELVTAKVPVLEELYTIEPPLMVPPTFKFPAIPTPPANVALPVVGEVEVVVDATVRVVPEPLVTLNVPELVLLYETEPPVIVPPTCKFPAIPTPPPTVRAPVVVDVACVV
jgi:hypothetical protein